MNTDGIDLVDTSDVVISDCTFHLTDDVTCVKNMSPDRTMRNIAETNCVMRTLCNAIKIGTDTAQCSQRILLVTGCRTVQQELFRTPRAGRMEGITLSNVRAVGTKYTSFAVGQPGEPIRDLVLSYIRIGESQDFYSEAPAESVPERTTA